MTSKLFNNNISEKFLLVLGSLKVTFIVMKQMWKWLRTPGQRDAALAVAGVLSISHFLFTPVICRGGSMRPSLRDGDVVLIDKWSHKYLGMSYHLNDIVICSVGKKRKKCKYTPTLYLFATNIFILHAPFEFQ